jgi:hypothetical protein
MTTPRRRVLRPPRTEAEDSRRLQKLSRWRDQLQQEQTGLTRWMCRLRRAFHELEKRQKTVRRLEREIAKLEQS